MVVVVVVVVVVVGGGGGWGVGGWGWGGRRVTRVHSTQPPACHVTAHLLPAHPGMLPSSSLLKSRLKVDVTWRRGLNIPKLTR